MLDIEENDFNSSVDKVINSNQSGFVADPGGSGKTSFLKLLQDKLKQQD